MIGEGQAHYGQRKEQAGVQLGYTQVLMRNGRIGCVLQGTTEAEREIHTIGSVMLNQRWRTSIAARKVYAGSIFVLGSVAFILFSIQLLVEHAGLEEHVYGASR